MTISSRYFICGTNDRFTDSEITGVNVMERFEYGTKDAAFVLLQMVDEHDLASIEEETALSSFFRWWMSMTWHRSKKKRL